MNIFYLHENPIQNAKWHIDKHIVKMPIEYAQLMSTAHRLLDGEMYIGKTAIVRNIKRWRLHDEREDILYKASHINHPSAIWVRESIENYFQMYKLYMAVLAEFTNRYGKVHMTDLKLRGILTSPPMQIDVKTFVDPYLAMPDDVKQDDVVEAYRDYYKKYKKSFAKWTNRRIPEFMTEPTHAGYAS